MSGQVMIAQIRSYEKTFHIPPVKILAISADTSEKERINCLTMGANQFLTKPIRSQKLGECLKNLFFNSNSLSAHTPVVKQTILIIDDDFFASAIMKRFLTGSYNIIQAFSSQKVNQ
jgi:DNA-binding response OmpR family regulator